MDVSYNKKMLRAYDMSRQNTTAPVQRGGQQIRRKRQNRAKEASDNTQIQRDKVLKNGEKLGVRVRVRSCIKTWSCEFRTGTCRNHC